MQAFGNDYVYIDAIHQKLKNLPELARFVSDRHFAIGSDGMVLICPSEKGDFRMRMFNPDGTEGEMCGNALRSVGKYVYDHRLTDKTDLVIETLGGMQHLTLTVTDGLVSNIRADIGEPRLSTAVIPVVTELPEFVEQPVQVLDRTFHITAVSWGNPHCAMYVDSVADLDVEGYGKTIEHMTSIFPNKTNVTFVEFVRKDYIKIRYAGIPNQDGNTNPPMMNGTFENPYPTWIVTDWGSPRYGAWYRWAYNVNNVRLYGSVLMCYNESETNTANPGVYGIRTSGYSQFAMKPIPKDGAVGNVLGIYGVYGQRWDQAQFQISVNRIEDLDFKAEDLLTEAEIERMTPASSYDPPVKNGGDDYTGE
mgnify:CR=1 FL=1